MTDERKWAYSVDGGETWSCEHTREGALAEGLAAALTDHYLIAPTKEVTIGEVCPHADDVLDLAHEAMREIWSEAEPLDVTGSAEADLDRMLRDTWRRWAETHRIKCSLFHVLTDEQERCDVRKLSDEHGVPLARKKSWKPWF